MFPEIHIFSLTLSTYGICTAVGLLLMGLVAYLLGRRYRIRAEDIIFGEIAALAGGFLGAHLLYGLTNIESTFRYLTVYFKEGKDLGYLWSIIYSCWGGMVYYGGLLGALAFGVIYCKIRKINTPVFADCFAVGIPLFHCFGRIGCFLSGCCYGIPSSFGFVAENALAQGCNGVRRFPVQLLEGGLNLIIFGVLLILFFKRIMSKKLIYIYLIMYSVVRFFDEFLRGDAYRGIWLGLSTSQWISAVIFVITGIILVRKYKDSRGRYNIS